MNGALVPGAVLQESPQERLERWMALYGDAILRTCFICLADAHLAEDAMQDTFVKAWKHMEQFRRRGEGAEKAWLTRIAINTCRDYRRNAWFRRVDLPGEMDRLPPASIAVPPPERELFLDVLRLPVKYRQAILLYYHQNMTLREMGEALHLSVSSARHRLKKAEALLRMDLEGRDPHEA